MIEPEPEFYSAVKRYLALSEGGLVHEMNPHMPQDEEGFFNLLNNAPVTQSVLEVAETEAQAQRDGRSGASCSWGAVDCPFCGDAALFPFSCLEEDKEKGYYLSLLKAIARCRQCNQHFQAAGSLHEPQQLAAKAPAEGKGDREPALLDKRVRREEHPDGSYTERTECSYDDGSASSYTRQVYANGSVSAKMYVTDANGQVSSYRLREPVDTQQRARYNRRLREAPNQQKSFWRRQFDLDKYGFALAWYLGLAVIIGLVAWLSS